MKPRFVTRTEDLIQAIKERREALGYSHLELDERVGLTDGHISKIEGFDRRWGKVAYRMSFTIDLVLQALGLRLVVMPEAMARELMQEIGEHTTRDALLLNRMGRKPFRLERSVCSEIKTPTVVRSKR